MRKLSTVHQNGLKHIQNESWLDLCCLPKTKFKHKERITNLPSPIQYTDMYMNKMQKRLFFYILACSHENCNDPFLRIFFKFSKKKNNKKPNVSLCLSSCKYLTGKMDIARKNKNNKKKKKGYTMTM